MNFLKYIRFQPTYSGLGLNYLSECSLKYKLNNVKNFIFRAYKLSSNYFIFNKEIQFLKGFFNNNGYTDKLFYQKVRNFLNETRNNNNINITQNQVIYFRFPYISNKINNIIENQIKRLSRTYFSDIHIRMVFLNSRIENFQS